MKFHGVDDTYKAVHAFKFGDLVCDGGNRIYAVSRISNDVLRSEFRDPSELCLVNLSTGNVLLGVTDFRVKLIKEIVRVGNDGVEYKV